MRGLHLLLCVVLPFVLSGCGSHFEWVKSSDASYRLDTSTGEVSKLTDEGLMNVPDLKAPPAVSQWQECPIEVQRSTTGDAPQASLRLLWKPEGKLYYFIQAQCPNCKVKGASPWHAGSGSLVVYDKTGLPILSGTIFEGKNSIISPLQSLLVETGWKKFGLLKVNEAPTSSYELGALPCTLSDYLNISAAACVLYSNQEMAEIDQIFEEIESKKHRKE